MNNNELYCESIAYLISFFCYISPKKCEYYTITIEKDKILEFIQSSEVVWVLAHLRTFALAELERKWKPVEYDALTVNVISLFRQFNDIWRGWKHPIRSRELQKIWLWNLYQMLVSIRRHKIKKIKITGLICKVQTKIPKNPIFRNATSRHANFTKFCKIVTIDLRNKPWKFQIDISKIGYFTEVNNTTTQYNTIQ